MSSNELERRLRAEVEQVRRESERREAELAQRIELHWADQAARLDRLSPPPPDL